MKISEKFDFLMEYLKKIGGGEFISFNNSVFLSERETADRNFALAYYMKENQSFPKGFILQETLDFYFQVSNILFIGSNYQFWIYESLFFLRIFKLLNSQYFWKWTNANPMKIFRQAATASKL